MILSGAVLFFLSFAALEVGPFFLSYAGCGAAHASPETFTRILVFGDVHVLGNRRRTELDVAWTDWGLYKSFRMQLAWLNPQIILFLGDNLDEGNIASVIQWKRYVERFYRLFRTSRKSMSSQVLLVIT